MGPPSMIVLAAKSGSFFAIPARTCAFFLSSRFLASFHNALPCFMASNFQASCSNFVDCTASMTCPGSSEIHRSSSRSLRSESFPQATHFEGQSIALPDMISRMEAPLREVSFEIVGVGGSRLVPRVASGGVGELSLFSWASQNQMRRAHARVVMALFYW